MVNNDGKDFKAWLEDRTFTKRGTMNRNTGDYLHREGWVTLSEDLTARSPINYYSVLTERAIQHLQFQVRLGRLKIPV